MKIEIVKFGDKLVSRPAGREAFFALQSYQLKDVPKEELIEIDFLGVKAMTPSWADEVITKVVEQYDNVTLLNTENVTVQATLKTLREYSGLRV